MSALQEAIDACETAADKMNEARSLLGENKLTGAVLCLESVFGVMLSALGHAIVERNRRESYGMERVEMRLGLEEVSHD